ncbi:MAG TPA: hypothetical protein VGB54_02545 [Allosphingosinicella sp.]|jgi:hypothetical protein
MSSTRTHTVIAAAREIAGEIRSVEDQMDRALAGKARLIATMLDKRLEAGLPARTGRNVLSHGLEAFSLARQAREEMLTMHEQLASLDLRELAVGDVLDSPKFTEQLRLVESNGAQAA